MADLERQELIRRYYKIRDDVEAVSIASNQKTKLIAVSKTNPFEKIETLYNEGHRDFGENYAQELVEKAGEAIKRGLTEIRWHFIGHLQTNKVKVLLPHLFLLHTIDRLSLAEELVKRSGGEKVSGLLELNIDHEESKSGLIPENVPDFLSSIDSLLSNLDLQGWMCIPKPGDEKNVLDSFKKMKALSQEYQGKVGNILSMGMSSDYKLAIKEGSSYVRVGTALFGERRSPK